MITLIDETDWNEMANKAAWYRVATVKAGGLGGQFVGIVRVTSDGTFTVRNYCGFLIQYRWDELTDFTL